MSTTKKTKTTKGKVKKEKKAKAALGTKEVAAHLGITPYQLRIILRRDEFYPDKKYTNYGWDKITHSDVKRLEKIVEAGGHKRKPGKKKTATKKVTKKESTK